VQEIDVATLQTQDFSSPELAPSRQEHRQPMMIGSGFCCGRDLCN
jgi:hypothetical protein